MADFNFVETDSAKIYTEIITSLMENCNEPLYPGDERRIFGEALVAVLVSVFSLFDDRAKQRTLQYARGEVLDAIGQRYNVIRAAPAPAYATFRFSVAYALTENIIINAGTRITTDGSVYFATDEIAVLQAGSLYVDVRGTCTDGTADNNGFTVGSIATLVDLIPYISSVQNTTVSIGGDDGEPYTEAGDNRFRERIRLAPAAMSTAGSESAYRYFAMSADPDIVAVEIICPDDQPNAVNIYPLMRNGTLPDADTLAKVEAVCSADAVRPMTDKVTAIAPTVVEYQVAIKYYCTKDDEAATIEAVESVGGAIDQYNAWQTTALGRGINPDQLRRFIFAPSKGVGALRADIIKPSFVELTKAQVAKLSGTPVITHEVVSL